MSPFQAILDYELGLGVPPGWVNFSISKSAPNGFWHRLERGEIKLGKDFYDGFNRDLHVQSLWEEFYRREHHKNPKLPDALPPLPRIDGEWLFNEMMTGSVGADPWMFPALQKLKASKKYILGALSNTIIFPPGHPLHSKAWGGPVKDVFDVFVSSAHVGLRKPDPKIYELAVKELDKFARANKESPRNRGLGWETGVQAKDILFLDDIGENLKAAKNAGFGTIKVNLGRAFEAVDELEKVTGLELEGDHPKIAVKPRLKLKANI